MSRGKRESQWLVLRRCMAIIRRVQRGPTGRDELLKAVREQEGAEAYGSADSRASWRRLENDLTRIRQELMVDIAFDSQAGGYVLRDSWTPLLDLPDEDLQTIAWLEQTFDLQSPQHDEVHGLLGRLRLFLGTQRAVALERRRTALSVDLGQRDEDEMAAGVWDGLTRALIERRRVAFDYLSPQYEDGLSRQHVVDPYERYFDTARGHYYLRGWCHTCSGPDGCSDLRQYTLYRLGRIANLCVLPQKLPPSPPAVRRYSVVYQLTPQVARLGITYQPEIAIQVVEREADGSAVVRGETENVFFAVRTLLHYGPNCRLLGGPEVLQEMRQVVREMAESYSQQG